MTECENLEQVADILGDGGPFTPNRTFNNVGQLVDALVSLGNSDEVFARHDDHLGLKNDLPIDFLRSPIVGINEEKFEKEIEQVLNQANIIISLSERELSDDDLEEIREDKRSRGEPIDD